jgi:ankyrin repeat protein
MKKLLYIFLFIGFSAFAQEKTIFDIARNGTIDEMKSLHKANPDIINTINENKSSPLILACYRGNTEVALYLIDNVKDVNYNSEMGTALMAAVVKGKTDLIHTLLHKGANINLTDAQGTTALMYAVQFKNIEIIKLLLAHKADKTKVNKDGKTAFEYAAFSGDEQIINLLK